MRLFEPTVVQDDLHVALDFAAGFGALWILNRSSSPLVVLSPAHGAYRMATSHDAVPPIAGDTVVCELPNAGTNLARLRGSSVHRIKQLFLSGISRASFTERLTTAVGTLSSQRLRGWVPMVRQVTLPTSLQPPPTGPVPDALMRRILIHLALEGRDGVDLRRWTPIGLFDGADGLRILAKTHRDGFVTPMAVIQDIVSFNGTVSYTPTRDAAPPEPLTRIEDLSRQPRSTDVLTQFLIPVFDIDDTRRPDHVARRTTFRRNATVDSRVFPLEYTNPSRAGGRRQRPFVPTSNTSAVLGSIEYPAPVGVTYGTWATRRNQRPWYDDRLDDYNYTTIRTSGMIRGVVIHDTTSHNSHNNLPNIHAHYLVHRVGHQVTQLADLLEHVNHAHEHSSGSIGIEVENDWNYLHSGYRPRGDGCTSGDTELEEGDGEGEHATDGRCYVRNAALFRGGPQEWLRVPPHGCLESTWRLVHWLTSARIPLRIPRLFTQLDPRYWPNWAIQSRSLGPLARRILTEWATALGRRPDWADHAFWHVSIGSHADRIIEAAYPGIYAHCAIRDGKGDGVFTIVYLWLRSLGRTHLQARRGAITLLESPVILVGTARFIAVPELEPPLRLERNTLPLPGVGP
ncbi:MAG: hypothetical protein AAGA48_35970 [Myxococcota bacterium]